MLGYRTFQQAILSQTSTIISAEYLPPKARPNLQVQVCKSMLAKLSTREACKRCYDTDFKCLRTPFGGSRIPGAAARAMSGEARPARAPASRQLCGDHSAPIHTRSPSGTAQSRSDTPTLCPGGTSSTAEPFCAKSQSVARTCGLCGENAFISLYRLSNT